MFRERESTRGLVNCPAHDPTMIVFLGTKRMVVDDRVDK